MDNLINKLVAEVPNLVAMIVLVYLFQRANERITKDFSETIKTRDALFLDMMQKLTAKLDSIDVRHAQHAQETTEGMEAMRRATMAKKRRITEQYKS
jgi:hypothetical protein